MCCHVWFYVSFSLFVGSFTGHFDNTIVPYRQPPKLHFKNMMAPYQLPLRLSYVEKCGCETAEKYTCIFTTWISLFNIYGTTYKYIHTYITYIHTYKHTYIHTNIHTYIQTNKPTNLQAQPQSETFMIMPHADVLKVQGQQILVVSGYIPTHRMHLVRIWDKLDREAWPKPCPMGFLKGLWSRPLP